MPSAPASDDPVDSPGPTLPRASSGVRGASGETLFKAGDRVAENIELVSVLGVGGMGDVWLANHLGLGTTVAVKFMSAALANDGALIERFAREAKLSSSIKSPHVVQIFDFATTHEGIPYIVMELIEGETLGARLLRDSKLGLEETSHILVQLVPRSSAKRTRWGVIHRDMKPDNVLLGEEERRAFSVRKFSTSESRSTWTRPEGRATDARRPHGDAFVHEPGAASFIPPTWTTGPRSLVPGSHDVPLLDGRRSLHGR